MNPKNKFLIVSRFEDLINTALDKEQKTALCRRLIVLCGLKDELWNR